MKPIPAKLAQTFFGRVNLEAVEREEFYNDMKFKLEEQELECTLEPVWRNYFKALYFGEPDDFLKLFGSKVTEIKMGAVEWFYYFDQGTVNRCVIEPFNEKHQSKLRDIFDYPINIDAQSFYLTGKLMIPALFDQLIIDGFQANEQGVFFDGGLPYKIHRQL